MKPRLTVLMPCYNAMPFLESAIESVLNQTFADFWLCIICDKSNDGSEECVKKCAHKDNRIKVIDNTYGKGILNARNLGLDVVETEYAALMDADDIAPDYRFEMQINYLDQYENVGGVGGLSQSIDELGNHLPRIFGGSCLSEKSLKAEMVFNNVIPNGSMMFRDSVVKEYNLRYRDKEVEDYMFWCEFITKSPIHLLPYILLYYRVNPNSRSQTIEERITMKERRNHLYKIFEYMLNENDLRLNEFQKKHLFETIGESNRPVSYSNKIINFFSYSSLQRQVRGKEWEYEFIKICEDRKKINALEKIKRIFI